MLVTQQARSHLARSNTNYVETPWAATAELPTDSLEGVLAEETRGSCTLAGSIRKVTFSSIGFGIQVFNCLGKLCNLAGVIK